MKQQQKLWVVFDENRTIVGTTLSRRIARQYRAKGDTLFGVALTKSQLKQIATAVNR